MKFFYLSNQRLPTEKAYGIQVAKMCEAFGGLGVDLELVAPRRKNPLKEDVFEYFRVKKSFKETMLPSLDFYLPGKLDILAVNLKSFLSALQLFFYSVLKKSDIIYSRDELPLYFLSFFKKNLVFEAHRFSKKRTLFYSRFKKRNLRIITISQNLKNEFVKFGFKPGNILVAHDGVDLKDFDIKITKEEARKKFNLPQNKILLGYVGQLRTMGMEKGIGLVFEALRSLPENIVFVLVGGEEKDIKFYKNLSKSKNLEQRTFFIGRVKHNLIPAYLKSFDILLIPFPYTKHYAFYMSPLKLFEYMASKRPIVATDLPTVREVLNENNSILVKPDDYKSLAAGIRFILENTNQAAKLAEQAFEDVKNYTWQKRVEKILGFIKN